MALENDREQRWFAYLLGEVAAEEGARIEAEMKAAPEEAAELKQLFESLAAWGRAPQPYQPLRVQDLDLGEALSDAPQDTPSHTRKRAILMRPWPWAVAAMFLLAASQVSFTFTLGDATVSWGRQEHAQETTTPDSVDPNITQRLEALEQHAVETGELVETVATTTLLLQDWLETTANELGYIQRAETQARYRDTQRLFQLFSQGPFSEPEWTQASYSPDNQDR